MRGYLRGVVLPVLVLGCVDLAPPASLKDLDARLPPVDVRAEDGPPDRVALPDFDGPVGGQGGIDADPGMESLPPPADSLDLALDTGGETPAADRSPDAPLNANGAACTAASQCASGQCADGICCNLGCTGACQACDVAGAVGTCTPVPAGADPDEECAQQAASTCGQDGTCDGAGACRRYAAGTQCAPGRCTGSTEYAASTCAPGGGCQAGASRSCAPNVCSGDSCASACTQQTDCQGGYFCDGTTCRSRRSNGAACTMAFQCGSGVCVDGVCCATACGQACHACNLTSTVGTCTPIADGQDPGGECPLQASSTCGRSGGCNGRGACRLHPSGTSCGSASCTGSTETAAAACDGAGSCQPGTTRVCPGTLCSGTTCAASCTSAAQCQSTHKCVRSGCVQRKIASLTVHDTVRAADWSIQQNFQIGTSGAHPWTDYPASYVAGLDAAASFFIGNEWIKVHAQSKTYTGGPQATIALAAAADVYLLIDDRWGLSPSWLAGWTNAGYNITVFENSTRPMLPFSVFRKTNQTGSVTVPSIGATTAFNYFIIVD